MRAAVADGKDGPDFFPESPLPLERLFRSSSTHLCSLARRRDQLRLVQHGAGPFEVRESDAVLEFSDLLTQSRLADG